MFDKYVNYALRVFWYSKNSIIFTITYKLLSDLRICQHFIEAAIKEII